MRPPASPEPLGGGDPPTRLVHCTSGQWALNGRFVCPELAVRRDVGREGTTVTVAPMRQTVESLSRRGLSVAEIEVITGHSSGMIESILGNA